MHNFTIQMKRVKGVKYEVTEVDYTLHGEHTNPLSPMHTGNHTSQGCHKDQMKKDMHHLQIIEVFNKQQQLYLKLSPMK